MGNFGKWLLGMIILGVVALLISLFAPAPWGAKANSVKMGESISSALEAGGSSAKVTMSGNVAKLTGELKSDSAKTSAIEIAQNTQCEKCAEREAGERWHVVDGSALTVEKLIVTPYTLTGERTADGGVILNGYVQDEAARAALLAEAERLFPGKVTDRTVKIAGGAPNANWNKVASSYLNDLSQLENGKFSMNDMSSVITGTAANAGIRDGINGAVSGLPTGYNGAANIAVPNVEADNAGVIESEDICQGLFESLKGDNKVNFAYNRAEIRGAKSEALLNNLASAATQCSKFQVTVEGHTDADGRDAYNLDLSQRRADSVAAYLVEHGVSSSSITSIGYGETNPVATNETAAGMARNRRIEFKVTQSK